MKQPHHKRTQMGFYGQLLKGMLALCIIMMPGSAPATQVTAPLLVSATVLSVCGVVATPLAFGNYSATTGTPLDASSTITATCTSGVAFTVALDAGVGTGATVATRVMLNSTNKLNYMIYLNSGHTTLWGDGTSSTSTQGTTAGVTPQVYTAYGRIPISQQAPTGVYGDTVTVTLSY